MKATHDGTCQLCHHRQRLPNGHLAQHGYTVDYGYYNGVCPGSNALPIEQDCMLVARETGYLRRDLRTAEHTLENFPDQPNPDHVLHYLSTERRHVRGRLVYDDHALHFVTASGQRVLLSRKATTDVRTRWAERLHAEEREQIEQRVRNLGFLLRRFERTLAEWEPRPLLPLTVPGVRPADQPAPVRGPTKKEQAVKKYRDAYRAKHGREAIWDSRQTTLNNDLLSAAGHLTEGATQNERWAYVGEKRAEVNRRVLAEIVNHEGNDALLVKLREVTGLEDLSWNPRKRELYAADQPVRDLGKTLGQERAWAILHALA